jgi:hypothetical protein
MKFNTNNIFRIFNKYNLLVSNNNYTIILKQNNGMMHLEELYVVNKIMYNHNKI